MCWNDYVDENGWHYDVSEALLPRDELPHFVTVRAWEEKNGARTRLITNRDLEGLFDAAGGQIAGTLQFSMAGKTPNQLVSMLRDKLKGVIDDEIEVKARELAPEEVESLERTLGDAEHDAREAEYLGAIDYEELMSTLGGIETERKARLRQIVERLMLQPRPSVEDAR